MVGTPVRSKPFSDVATDTISIVPEPGAPELTVTVQTPPVVVHSYSSGFAVGVAPAVTEPAPVHVNVTVVPSGTPTSPAPTSYHAAIVKS